MSYFQFVWSTSLRNLDERDDPEDVRSEESKHHDNLTNAEEHLHSAPAKNINEKILQPF